MSRSHQDCDPLPKKKRKRNGISVGGDSLDGGGGGSIPDVGGPGDEGEPGRGGVPGIYCTMHCNSFNIDIDVNCVCRLL